MKSYLEIFLITITFSSSSVISFSFVSLLSAFNGPINNYDKKNLRLGQNPVRAFQWLTSKSRQDRYISSSRITGYGADEVLSASNHFNDTNTNNAEKLRLTIVLIDNYDSYTYNLYQYFCEMVDNVIVIPNDIVPIMVNGSTQPHPKTWDAVLSYLNVHYPAVKRIDSIVLGPGPGNPNVSEDVGICTAVSFFL